jgi:hypothetical protein
MIRTTAVLRTSFILCLTSQRLLLLRGLLRGILANEEWKTIFIRETSVSLLHRRERGRRGRGGSINGGGDAWRVVRTIDSNEIL